MVKNCKKNFKKMLKSGKKMVIKLPYYRKLRLKKIYALGNSRQGN